MPVIECFGVCVSLFVCLLAWVEALAAHVVALSVVVISAIEEFGLCLWLVLEVWFVCCGLLFEQRGCPGFVLSEWILSWLCISYSHSFMVCCSWFEINDLESVSQQIRLDPRVSSSIHGHSWT